MIFSEHGAWTHHGMSAVGSCRSHLGWDAGQLQPCLMSAHLCHTAGRLHGREVHHSSLFHHGRADGQCADNTQQDDWVRSTCRSVGLVLSSNASVSSPRGAMGYCFVEMSDEATAERCLRKINGKSLPGASPVCLLFFPWWKLAATKVESFCYFLQPTRFKLNRATFGKQDIG